MEMSLRYSFQGMAGREEVTWKLENLFGAAAFGFCGSNGGSRMTTATKSNESVLVVIVGVSPVVSRQSASGCHLFSTLLQVTRGRTDCPLTLFLAPSVSPQQFVTFCFFGFFFGKLFIYMPFKLKVF